ncbi:uncharacterized protein [Taeniopygia guttata]|uniref:uncharacterized protein isoform X2 n=1 Tax=Taeniopygia guttata TaxID=59729 RepID=UPI003BB8C517
MRGEQAAPRDEGPRLLLSKLPPLARRWGSAFCYSFCRDSQRLGSLLCPGPARHGKEGPGAASPLERGGGRAGPLPGSGRPARNSNVLRLHSGRLLSRRAPRRPGTRPAGAGTVRRGRGPRREPRQPPPRLPVLSTCRAWISDEGRPPEPGAYAGQHALCSGGGSVVSSGWEGRRSGEMVGPDRARTEAAGAEESDRIGASSAETGDYCNGWSSPCGCCSGAKSAESLPPGPGSEQQPRCGRAHRGGRARERAARSHPRAPAAGSPVAAAAAGGLARGDAISTRAANCSISPAGAEGWSRPRANGRKQTNTLIRPCLQPPCSGSRRGTAAGGAGRAAPTCPPPREPGGPRAGAVAGAERAAGSCPPRPALFTQSLPLCKRCAPWFISGPVWFSFSVSSAR